MTNRKVTVFTYIDRHSYFLDKWLEYYTQIFEQDEILILHSKKTEFDLPKYLDEMGYFHVTVVEIEGDKDSFTQPRDLFNDYQKQLLQTNSVVIYSDIDEIIFHPELRRVINTFKSDYLTLKGFEIIHDSQVEPIKKSESIISQRTKGKYSDWYNKPLIVRNELTWELGKHNISTPNIFEENLFLVHLNKICKRELNEQNEQNKTIYKNILPHNSLVGNDLTDWFDVFFNDSDLVEIPTIIKNKLKI